MKYFIRYEAIDASLNQKIDSYLKQYNRTICNGNDRKQFTDVDSLDKVRLQIEADVKKIASEEGLAEKDCGWCKIDIFYFANWYRNNSNDRKFMKLGISSQEDLTMQITDLAILTFYKIEFSYNPQSLSLYAPTA